MVVVCCCSPLSSQPAVAACVACVFGAGCDTVAIAEHTPATAARTQHVPARNSTKGTAQPETGNGAPTAGKWQQRTTRCVSAASQPTGGNPARYDNRHHPSLRPPFSSCSTLHPTLRVPDLVRCHTSPNRFFYAIARRNFNVQSLFLLGSSPAHSFVLSLSLSRSLSLSLWSIAFRQIGELAAARFWGTMFHGDWPGERWLAKGPEGRQ
uniref:Putative secreted protein n=1 Tax=Anopheles triannulatus TaxID=58253 RepID=A0A2M4B2Q2_9DIPT